MNQVKLLFRQLFFYSSRQLLRRKRSYLSIFVTSAVLLALVMTFLELAESTYLREIDTARSGTYHASILALPDDYTEEFQSHSRVESVFTVPDAIPAAVPGSLDGVRNRALVSFWEVKLGFVDLLHCTQAYL